MVLTSREEVQTQYKDASNLNARSAIYRFGTCHGPSWSQWVFDQFHSDLPADARVLEIGCGDGGLWKGNADRLPAGWRVTLCDVSPGMLAAAARDLPAFDFVQSDAEELPFADRSFHAVVANHMLYHVENRVRALREVRRVLMHEDKPGGRLYATTNSDLHLQHMKDLIARFLGDGVFMSMPFNLENAESQLRCVFDQIELRRLGGELRITDADAVVGYVMSISEAPTSIVGERFKELNRIVRDEIADKEAFIVTTATGMFIAQQT